MKMTQQLSERILSDAHKMAFMHLSQIMKKYGANQFMWLRVDRTDPGFDNFLFAYKNQVFSVFVRLFYRGKDIMTKDVDQMFWNLTRRNNMIPCVFSLDLKTLGDRGEQYELIPRDPNGWNLVNFNTGNKVIPQELNIPGKIEMSEYEKINMAVRVALHFLVDNNDFKIRSFCDTPGFIPNIWFSDNDGRIAWLCVGIGKGNPDKIAKPDIQELLTSKANGYDGFFFPVGADCKDEKLYRESKIILKHIGLIKIHDAQKAE